MSIRTLQHDFELDNAVFFGSYVLVITEGEMTGGGRVNGYDENEVVVGGRKHSRHTSAFVLTQPPQIKIDFI
ncbi:hypothetical protein [Paenibacillus borealis]|uniref:Uncharacterized protein n=1 Tax=Paenibacillus borealis TaxID=160799 RepID=A0A089MJM9_PAEBO|nr:hypothetical protein [Paenibacillus borealis]AIQ56764.1 hypothetical protein PBOR_07275 [Paenibacillus borealis]